MDFEYCIISLQTKTNRQKVVTNMKFKIGFTAEQTKNNNTMTANCERKTQTEIRRSVVQVYFPQRHMELAYYNDMFDLKNGDVGNIVCSCYCSYNCKHEFAVLLQLRNVLNLVEKNYGDDFRRSEYFMAINKKTLLNFAVDCKEVGVLSL